MTNTLDLNGEWLVSWSEAQRWQSQRGSADDADDAQFLKVNVPGELHVELEKLGLIDDPYVGLNCLKARWVEEAYWSYRKVFEASTEAVGARAWLYFETLDLVAKITLNGELIGKQVNAFHPCRIDVTGKLKEGKNVLHVEIECGLYDVAEKPVDTYMAGSVHDKLYKRVWMRKPQFQFGWDWATRLGNVGITGDVRLEWTSAPARVDTLVPLVTVTDDLATGQVRARLFVEGLKDEAFPARLTVTLDNTGRTITTDVDVKPGLNPVETNLTIENPDLWWPVGHGAQPLYNVSVKLEADGAVLGERSARVGFRHVRVNQEPHPEVGRFFILEINGKKIFAKGGNFVPADMIYSKADRKQYDALTDLALELNFNMLRIWGGGVYEKKEFYDACDEKGILVWQEFIFACARYPATDQTFHESFKAEATYNIRRLAQFPSLVIWCGNNEMEWGDWEWGFDRNGAVLPDYSLFHLTIPRLMQEEDPTRYYQPSSPYSPDMITPNADHVGDQHPWSCGIFGTNYWLYRDMICRFPNEGGILGPTSLATIQACLPEGQKHYRSFAWRIHDNSISDGDWPSINEKTMLEFFGKDMRPMSLEEVVYWGGLLQGEGLREYIDNFRRRMFSSASAIYWMYNDCWPATRSWTPVDFYLRRTPSFAPVKRASAPVSIVVVQEGEEIVVYGVNDTSDTVEGTLRYGALTISGEYPIDLTANARLEPNASTRLVSFPTSDWKAVDANLTCSAAFATLSQGSRLLSRNRLFLTVFKDLEWSPADVSVRVEGGEAIFESKTFALGVCIDLNGEEPLGDNFFDVFPGQPYRIAWAKSDAPKVLFVGNLA